jgi:hypothetical protein
VVIASPRGAEGTGRTWNKLGARIAREDAEAFERSGHVWASEAVVPMLPLHLHSDQVLYL